MGWNHPSGPLRRDPWNDCAAAARFTSVSRLLFYAPRGPIYQDAAAFSELVDAAAEYAKAQGAYMLRIDPEIPETDAEMLALIQQRGFVLNQAADFSLFQPRLCYVSDLTGKDEETLAASFQRSTRQNIHKALGVRCQ